MIERLVFAQHRPWAMDVWGDDWLDVRVERFPHYRCLAGEADVFRDYLRASWGTDTGVDEHVAAFMAFAEQCRRDGAISGGPVTLLARGEDLLVIDGNHRAAIAAFHDLPLPYTMIGLAEYAEMRVQATGSRFGSLHGVPCHDIYHGGRLLVQGHRDVLDRRALIDRADMQGRRVLDMGCNLGADSLYAHEMGATVEGWDHEPSLVTSALRLAVAFGYGIMFRVADVSSPPRGEWDTGFCFSVHEHADVRQAMQQCRVVYMETHRNSPPPTRLTDGWSVELRGRTDRGRRRLYRLERCAP